MKCPICKKYDLAYTDAPNGRQAAHCPKCNRGRALFVQDKPAPAPVAEAEPAATRLVPRKESKSE